ncbi:VPLPA-CTERM sorting domain-containing protein [Rhodobacter maris]|uniref:Secreted protein n=1 Tax=Rhodobacter maris TaxID=446682 RepID=A0A285RIR3_9RHOB|nr:VPLPA-CTERM sorting domain-containing protein [Rhodobacter maris]SOB94025.1 hypothetical protein SAMN05877831_101309 [Rhodobacter maris]
MNMKYWISAALIAAALPAGAATVTESGSGEFSSVWTSPTVIAAGTDTVTGSGSGGDVDVIELTGLDSSVTGITIDFSAASYYSSGWYGAGGSVLYSTEPFEWAWDGTSAGGFSIGYLSSIWGTIGSLEDTLTIALSGVTTLYIAIVNTYGSKLDYTLSVNSVESDQQEPLAAVPLSASAGLLLTGMAALAAFGRRRKARLA